MLCAQPIVLPTQYHAQAVAACLATQQSEQSPACCQSGGAQVLFDPSLTPSHHQKRGPGVQDWGIVIKGNALTSQTINLLARLPCQGPECHHDV